MYNPRTKLFHRVAQKGIPQEKYMEMVNQPVSKKHYEKLMQDRFRVSHSYLVRWWHDEVQLPEDISYTVQWDEETEWNPNDMLLIPLYSRDDNLRGVISVDKPPQGKVPHRNVLIALEILSALAARAMEESESYEKTTLQLARMEFLYDISARAATIDTLKTFCDYICLNLRAKFKFLWTGILFTDQETGTLYMSSQSGLEDIHFSGVRYKIGREGGIAGTVAALGQYKIVDDTKEQSQKFFTFHYKARSVLAVPVRKYDRVLGVLVIESDDVFAFGQDDRRFARTVANQIASTMENLEIRKSMEEELRVRRTLFDISSMITSILEPSRLFRKIMDILRNTFNYSSAALFTIDEVREYLVIRAVAGLTDREVGKFKLKIGQEGVVGLVASTGKSVNVPDVSKFPLFVPGFSGARSALSVPIEYRGQILGVLDVESEKLNDFSETDEQILKLLATQIAIALNNAKLYEKLESLATTDGLTGLHNYRSFSDILSNEVNRSKRLKHSLALLFADLDWFKKYNDTYGHPQGDKVLQLFADIVKAYIREDVDIAARYGGEEFAVLLPEVEVEEAVRIAERIRREFEKQSENKLLRKVTVSFGVATFPEDGTSAQALLKSADKALYKAKSQGRNRTCKAENSKRKQDKKQNNGKKKK